MTKIYSRTGDAGETALLRGVRVRKDDDRIDACGTIDELNSVLGVARAEIAGNADSAELDSLLARLQHQLFNLGAEMATPDTADADVANQLDTRCVQQIEDAIDHYSKQLDPLRQFILPGGCKMAARLHVARAVCRRAERAIVRVAAAEQVRPEILAYINRLSDFLFVLARWSNRQAGVPDTAWQADVT